MNFSERLLQATFVASLLASCVPAGAQADKMQTTSPSSSTPDAPSSNDGHGDSAVFVAGLENIKPGSSGELRITEHGLLFLAKDARATIPLERMTAVSTGDERVATGGTAVRIARLTPVFGVGPLTGAATHKKVDVLTVEFWEADGYHGAVFEVPRGRSVLEQKQLMPFVKSQPVDTAADGGIGCSEQGTPHSLLIAPITSEGIALPAEYRVLLYEQTVAQLKKANPSEAIYRAGAGPVGGRCAARTLHLSVIGFKKGNEALRASTGPIGFFVGDTSVKVHVSVIDDKGRAVFTKDLNQKKYGDHDSLSVARNVAKDVSTRLTKNEGREAQAAKL